MKALVYVEGKDDVAALTEIYKRFFGFEVQREGERLVKPQYSRLFAHPERDHQLEIINGRDRLRALKQAVDHYNERKFTNYRIDRVGLIFDPDADTDDQWRSRVVKAFAVEESTPQDELGGYLLGGDAQVTTLLPTPWDVGEVLDDLDGALRCLERVALDVLLRAIPDQADLVVDLLDLIRGRGIKITWKTAFRLANAIRKPSAEDGFPSQVFGQDEDLRPGIQPSMQSTLLWNRLAFLGGSVF